MDAKPLISVIIKTFNEASGIVGTIESVKAQLSLYPHKIIVADSLSTDSTQALAVSQGVTVVSLTNPSDRCCGVGPQLGYLYSEGEFILLLDGDMTLQEGFIEQAVSFLQENVDYAGVAGSVSMNEVDSYEFKSRQQRMDKIYPVGDCDHLGGGGLYRREAIEQIGYLTNRNLHAYEEAELGIRLKKSGYKLHRLATPFFYHVSYDMPSMELLKYRWKNKYVCASGELLRGGLQGGYFPEALKKVKNEAVFAVYLIVLFLALISTQLSLFGVVLLPLLAFFVLKWLKNKSYRDAAQSIINLSVFSAGLIKGLLRPVRDPNTPPEHTLIQK